MVIKELPFKTKLNLGMASAHLRKLMAAEKQFQNFDLSFFTTINDDVLEFIEVITPAIKTLKIAGPLFDLEFCQTLYDVVTPFRFLTALKLSHTCVVLSLDFLAIAPVTLRHLQLDYLNMLPTIEFVHYVPVVANHLTVLEMRNNPQLTKYDLVNILQRFNVLEVLDICDSEYLTAGTCGTIACYCYNLDKFYFSMDFRPSDCKAWIQLLGMDFEHLEFTDEVYSRLTHYYKIEQQIDNGENYDFLDSEEEEV